MLDTDTRTGEPNWQADTAEWRAGRGSEYLNIQASFPAVPSSSPLTVTLRLGIIFSIMGCLVKKRLHSKQLTSQISKRGCYYSVCTRVRMGVGWIVGRLLGWCRPAPVAGSRLPCRSRGRAADHILPSSSRAGPARTSCSRAGGTCRDQPCSSSARRPACAPRPSPGTLPTQHFSTASERSEIFVLFYSETKSRKKVGVGWLIGWKVRSAKLCVWLDCAIIYLTFYIKEFINDFLIYHYGIPVFICCNVTKPQVVIPKTKLREDDPPGGTKAYTEYFSEYYLQIVQLAVILCLVVALWVSSTSCECTNGA